MRTRSQYCGFYFCFFTPPPFLDRTILLEGNVFQAALGAAGTEAFGLLRKRIDRLLAGVGRELRDTAAPDAVEVRTLLLLLRKRHARYAEDSREGHGTKGGKAGMRDFHESLLTELISLC